MLGMGLCFYTWFGFGYGAEIGRLGIIIGSLGLMLSLMYFVSLLTEAWRVRRENQTQKHMPMEFHDANLQERKLPNSAPGVKPNRAARRRTKRNKGRNR